MKKENTVFQIRINQDDLAEIKKAASEKGVPAAVFIKETMKKASSRIIAKANR